MSLSRGGYLLVLAAAAGAILVVGALLRPPDTPPSTGPSEAELSRLMQLARRRAADDLADVLSSVADRVAPSLLRVSSTGLTGVIWRPETLVTARLTARLPELVSVVSSSGDHQGRTAGRGPYAALASVRTGAAIGQPVVRGAAAEMEPGDWIVAVWMAPGRPAFASGHLVDVVSPPGGERPALAEVRSTVPLDADMAGGGLFDLDGQLVAVIVAQEGRMAALAVEGVDDVLAQAETFEGRLLDRFGLRVGELTPAEAAHLRAQAGLVVREVWDDSIAEEAGLSPGDVITALNDSEVTNLSHLGPLAETEPAVETTVAVHWRGSRRTVSLTPADPTPDEDGGEPRVGGVSWGGRGFAVDAVAPGSRPEAAGIRPGDRLVRIDRVEPRTLEQVERVVRGGLNTTAFLEFRRGARRWGVLF